MGDASSSTESDASQNTSDDEYVSISLAGTPQEIEEATRLIYSAANKGFIKCLPQSELNRFQARIETTFRKIEEQTRCRIDYYEMPDPSGENEATVMVAVIAPSGRNDIHHAVKLASKAIHNRHGNQRITNSRQRGPRFDYGEDDGFLLSRLSRVRFNTA